MWLAAHKLLVLPNELNTVHGIVGSPHRPVGEALLVLASSSPIPLILGEASWLGHYD